MKKLITLILSLALMVILAGCNNKEVTWNGETECLGDLTMLLIAAETPSGELVMDSGLPEAGKQYVFLAYAQPDGSLTLSEIFDNREYNEELLAEYQDYVENEIPFESFLYTIK